MMWLSNEATRMRPCVFVAQLHTASPFAAADGSMASDKMKKSEAISKILRLGNSRNAGPSALLHSLESLIGSSVADLLDQRDFVVLMRVLGRAGQFQRAVMLHDQMIALGVKPNLLTFSAALSACADAAVISYKGKRATTKRGRARQEIRTASRATELAPRAAQDLCVPRWTRRA